MRILILSDRYPPHYGGGYGLKCGEISEGLAKRGHTIFVLTTKFGLNKEEISGNVFRLLECCGGSSVINIHKKYLQTQLRRALMFRKNYWITKKIIKQIKPDLVYVWHLYDISILPLITVQKQKIPCYFEIADYWLISCKAYYNQSLQRRFLRFILTGIWNFNNFDFNYMNFCCQMVKQKYIAAGFREKNFSVISGGIKCEPESNGPGRKIRNSNRIRLLCAARLVEDKGIHVAIEAVGYLINILKYRNVTLDIIGAGNKEYIRKLKEIVRFTKIKDQVRFISEMLHNEFVQCLKNYDLLLFPSIYEEPFARTILQAMTQGLPVIASKTGGTIEVVKDGVTGMLVAPGDIIGMAEAIKKLIEDSNLYKQVSINGIREIRKNYSQEKNIEQIDRYFRDTFNQSKE